MKSSDPLLLADGTLRSVMYPAGKVAISWGLATFRFPWFDHTVGKLSADAGLLCSELYIADLLTSSHTQMSASHLLWLQGPQQTLAYNNPKVCYCT